MSDPTTSIETLLAPVAADEFFSQYWQRQPLMRTAGPDDRFANLLDRSDVDGLVSTTAAQDGKWVMLTRGGKPLSTAAMRNQDQFLDLTAIYKAYQEGYTLILTMLQKRWPAIGRFCRDLEMAFSAAGVILSRPIGGNLYLTPALPLLPPADQTAEEQLVQLYKDRAHALLGRDVLATARGLAASFSAGLEPLPEDGFCQLDSLDSVDLDTEVTRRVGLPTDLETEGDHSNLRFLGSGFRGPLAVEPVFRFIQETESFRVVDLPDPLSGTSKVELVRQLIRDGLLRITGDRTETD